MKYIRLKAPYTTAELARTYFEKENFDEGISLLIKLEPIVLTRDRKKLMSKINILIICFLFLSSLSSDSNIGASELVAQLWAPNCEKLKKGFLVDQSLNVIFTNKPNLKIYQTPWTIFWNNVEVPVPNVDYKHIYVSSKNKNEYEIWLQTIDGVIISLMVGEDKLMKDVFAKTSGNGEEISTPEGVLTTKDMFGGPVKMSTIMKRAYRSTPDLLTCMEENRIRESAIASALILKGTATNNLMAVYEGIGEYDGWITKSTDENIIEYTLNIIPADTNNQLFYINYRMPEGSKYNYLPFCAGRKKDTAKDTHSWLVSLNNAIEMKTNDGWKEFISAAKENGISEKSISRTCDKLKIKP